MKTFRYLDFTVYKKSKEYYKDILQILSQLDRKYQFSIGDQLRRSTLSVVLNIAEGSAKKSDKDFCRHLQYSVASINETVACLDVLLLEKVITQPFFESTIAKAEILAKQIGSFMCTLNKKPKSQYSNKLTRQ